MTVKSLTPQEVVTPSHVVICNAGENPAIMALFPTILQQLLVLSIRALESIFSFNCLVNRLRISPAFTLNWVKNLLILYVTETSTSYSNFLTTDAEINQQCRSCLTFPLLISPLNTSRGKNIWVTVLSAQYSFIFDYFIVKRDFKCEGKIITNITIKLYKRHAAVNVSNYWLDKMGHFGVDIVVNDSVNAIHYIIDGV